ncbi:MAG: cyclic nucleotide-binding and patatin-like phospholipase domain-containing protein [Bradymonadia bacterium]
MSPLELLVKTEFFAGLAPAAQSDLEDAIRLRRVPAGAALIEQGAAGDALYVLRHGRLRVELAETHGPSTVLAEISVGELFGEMAMLVGDRRATTVRAVRESEVIELSRAAFDTLAASHPELLRRLATLLAQRLRAANHRTPRGRVFGTVALVRHRPSVDLRGFSEQLAAALRPYRAARVVMIDDALGGPGLDDAGLRERVLPWLAVQEAEGSTLLLVTDPDADAWTRFALAQADVVLVVADGTDTPPPGRVEAGLRETSIAARELVLLYAPSAQPEGTAAWLAGGRFARHHHLRRDDRGDLRRLARWLAGKSLGVAFGGGGARGFAHIGLVRAFAEAGLEIDRVGGTSMGSIIAAQVALGWTWPTMLDRTREAFREDPLKNDNTLPLVSLITGKRVVKLVQSLFGALRTEDAWLPHFAMLCNLSRAEPIVRRQGPLWQMVRASSALPGIGPPVIENGDFIVDGAIFNNVPADVLLDDAAGPVVAVNVSPRDDLRTSLPDNYAMSGWDLLWNRMRGVKGAAEYPSMLAVVQRAVLLHSIAESERLGQRASLYVHPRLDQFDMFAWQRIDEISTVGYTEGRDALAAWVRTLGTRTT